MIYSNGSLSKGSWVDCPLAQSITNFNWILISGLREGRTSSSALYVSINHIRDLTDTTPLMLLCNNTSWADTQAQMVAYKNDTTLRSYIGVSLQNNRGLSVIGIK